MPAVVRVTHFHPLRGAFRTAHGGQGGESIRLWLKTHKSIVFSD